MRISHIGKKMSEESKIKNREKHLKKNLSEETILKMKAPRKSKNKKIPWNKGKINVYSDKTLQKMKNAKKGKIHNQETIKKMKISHKGKHKGPITEIRRLSIIEGIKRKNINKENPLHYGEELRNITA